MDEADDVHRIYVGGLFPSVTKEDLRDKFKSFGNLTDVFLVQRKDTEGYISKTFGYVSLQTSEQQLKKCFALFGRTKWKGHELKVQVAKDNFMKRLEEERKNPTLETKKSKKRKMIEPIKSYEEILSKTVNLKRAVPGALIEGEKDWVIGKYGRPLPIVYIPRISGRKAIKFDPSKQCHCLRRINCDDDEDVRISDLKYSLTEEKIIEKKNKKGESDEDIRCSSSEWEKKKKKTKDVEENDVMLVDKNTIESIEVTIPNESKKKHKKENVAVKKDANDIEGDSKRNKKSINDHNKIVDVNYDINKSEGIEQKLDIDSNDLQKKKKKKKKRTDMEDVNKNGLTIETSNHGSCNKKDDDLVGLSESETESLRKGKLSESESEIENESKHNLSVGIVEQLLKLQKRTKMEVYFSPDNTKSFIKQDIVRVPQNNSLNISLDETEIESDSDRENNASNLSVFDFDFDTLDDMKSETGKLIESAISVESVVLSESENEVVESSEFEIEPTELSSEIKQSNIAEALDQLNKRKCRDDLISSTAIKKKTFQMKGDTAKHALSEEARKMSLEKRNKVALKNKDLIKNALKNIDDAMSVASNRVVFSDTESGDENNKPVVENGIHTLKMLWDDDEDDDGNIDVNRCKRSNLELFDELDEENSSHFRLKHQFQGEKGEKLFKLQQRYGGDDRFHLDKRFADDEDDDDDDDSNNNVDLKNKNNDETVQGSVDLKTEREKSLSVLEKVLGKSFGFDTGKRTSIRNTVYERYDPTNEEHVKKYEVEELEERKEKAVKEDPPEKEIKTFIETKPEVSSETFFEVNQSLKSLFTNSTQVQPTFSFLGGNDVENGDNKVDSMDITPKVDIKKNVNWRMALDETKKTSVESEELNEEELVEEEIENKKTFNFFFTNDDERLELGKTFVRVESIEEITEQWKSIRSGLNEDYKKKHKDAIRRVRKVKERRFSRY